MDRPNEPSTPQAWLEPEPVTDFTVHAQETQARRRQQRLVGRGYHRVGAHVEGHYARGLAGVEQGRAAVPAGHGAERGGIQEAAHHVAGVSEHQQPMTALQERFLHLFGVDMAFGIRWQHRELDAGVFPEPVEGPHHRAVFQGGGEHLVARIEEAVEEQVQ